MLPRIVSWKALTLEGEWISDVQFRQRSSELFDTAAPVDTLFKRLREFIVQLEHGLIRIAVDPVKGEQAAVFTRHRKTAGGIPDTSMPVFEIRQNPDRPDLFVRLYLHPELGPVLTTQDLYC